MKWKFVPWRKAPEVHTLKNIWVWYHDTFPRDCSRQSRERSYFHRRNNLCLCSTPRLAESHSLQPTYLFLNIGFCYSHSNWICRESKILPEIVKKEFLLNSKYKLEHNWVNIFFWHSTYNTSQYENNYGEECYDMSAKSLLVSRASVVVLGLQHSDISPWQKMLIGRLVWVCFSVPWHLVVPLNNCANWFTL